MSDATSTTVLSVSALLGRPPSLRLVERNIKVLRSTWWVPVSGMAEPLFYILWVSLGLGRLLHDVHAGDGQMFSYEQFAAPALLAVSAMNGAVYESTLNVFYRLKFAGTYKAVLSTPLTERSIVNGEIVTAGARGMFYALTFLVLMAALGDLVWTWWLLLAVPAALLITGAFATAGVAAVTYMRSWDDAEYISVAVLPMFLFSTTFFPLGVYPRALQLLIELTPLIHAINLMRALTVTGPDTAVLLDVAYLMALMIAAYRLAVRRFGKLLLS